MTEIPLFPLKTILLPEVPLSLQVFEQRYIKMISSCLKDGEGFGIVLIRDGSEVGRAPLIFPVGLYVTVQDWHRQGNGMLGISVAGELKFSVKSTRIQDDQLLLAKVKWHDPEPKTQVSARFDGLARLLTDLRQHPEIKALNLPEPEYACQLGWQLTQLLPISKPEQVALLAIDDPDVRLQRIAEHLERLASG